MSTGDFANLTTCFNAEIAILKSLINVVQEEKQRLINREFADLETIAQQKESLIADIEPHTKKRLNILGIEPGGQKANDRLQIFLNKLPSKEQTTIKKLNEELGQLLLKCQEQNTINGQVISANLNLRKNIIDNLTGKSPHTLADRYTATGNIDEGKLRESNDHQKA